MISMLNTPNTKDLVQQRLKSRWPKVIQEATEIRKSHPDPVQAMVELLSGISGDYAVWREIIEDPYA